MKAFSFSSSSVKLVAAAVLMVVIFSEMHISEAATCSVSQLSSCAPAITANAPPSSTCCSNLKAQQPCFCQYLKDPSLKQFVSSPGAKRVANSCGVQIPSNC